MGQGVRQRRRLPRRVYWVRRGLVLGLALLLVFGIGKLLGGNGADTASSVIEAEPSAAKQTPTESVVLGPVAPTGKLTSKVKVPLAPPNGVCRDDEVSAVPSVPQAWAGGPIVIKVRLTGTRPACTFEVNSESLVVKVAKGERRLWSSQDCLRSIRPTQVVVRSALAVEVPVLWSGRRSDEQCTTAPGWVMPGFYHVFAAAAGSSPSDVQFEVTLAPTQRITKTPKPRPSSSTSPEATKSSPAPSAKPSKKP